MAGAVPYVVAVTPVVFHAEMKDIVNIFYRVTTSTSNGVVMIASVL